jgi:hypothetical protein
MIAPSEKTTYTQHIGKSNKNSSPIPRVDLTEFNLKARIIPLSYQAAIVLRT